MVCKHCNGSDYTKNGFQGSKQRFKCKACMKNFTQGDKRNIDRSREKYACFLLYSMGKSSMRFLADTFGVSVGTVHSWIQDIAGSIPESKVGEDIKELEIDEIWHYISKKLKNCGYSKHMTAIRGELSHGLQGIVILQRCGSSTAN